MLAISERDKPCSARISPSSLGRVTVMTPSAFETSIGGVTSTLSSPFGPFTLTWRPLIATSTPLGIVMGCRPIRDIAGSLPDVGEDFPAHALLLRLLVSHQAGGCRDDRHAQAAEHPRQVVLAGVHPQSGLGDALEARDGALPGRSELERNHQVLANLGVLHLPAGDVALLLENLRNVHLDLGVRHRDGVVVGRIGVAEPGQHVCDRVSHGHGLVAFLAAVSLCFEAPGPSAWSVGAGWHPGRSLPWELMLPMCRSRGGYQLDLVMPGSSPRCAIDRKQIRHRPNRW